MPLILVNGKKISEQILSETTERVKKLTKKPFLAVVLVGSNASSVTYVEKKRQACIKAGVKCSVLRFPAHASQEEVISKIKELNEDSKINGILVQLPLPKHFDKQKILDSILPEKDVDGLTSLNQGKISTRQPCLVSATALAVKKIMEWHKISVKGKKVVIINHGTLIGKPLALLLLNENATVTVCHKFTENLSKETRTADILVSATGVPNLIKANYLKEKCVAIDAGFSKENNEIKGDFDSKQVIQKCSLFTPVPGGVGPITVAMLVKNTLKAFLWQEEKK